MNCSNCNNPLRVLFTSTYCDHCENNADIEEGLKRWWTFAKENWKIGDRIPGESIVYSNQPATGKLKRAWITPIGIPQKLADCSAGVSFIAYDVKVTAFV